MMKCQDDRNVKYEHQLCVLEIGAGTAVPTVRNFSSEIASRFKCPLIRINLNESQNESQHALHIGLAMSAKNGIQALLSTRK
jgi:hypothetical protein